MRPKDIEKIAGSVVGSFSGAASISAGCGSASSTTEYLCSGLEFMCDSNYECGGAGNFSCGMGSPFGCLEIFGCASAFDCPGEFSCFSSYNL